MHISDGVVPTSVWIGSYVVTIGISTICAKKMKAEDMPKMAVMTSAFFVASLIHVPLGPTSVHLILNGLVGIILGPLSFISILVGLTLQSLLFQHGGITVIGVNTITMGIPALFSWKIFNLSQKFRFRLSKIVFGVIAAAFSVFLGTILLSIFLITSGSKFIPVAKYAALAHLPIMIIEGIITGFVISFLMKVKPEILKRG